MPDRMGLVSNPFNTSEKIYVLVMIIILIINNFFITKVRKTHFRGKSITIYNGLVSCFQKHIVSNSDLFNAITNQTVNSKINRQAHTNTESKTHQHTPITNTHTHAHNITKAGLLRRSLRVAGCLELASAT